MTDGYDSDYPGFIKEQALPTREELVAQRDAARADAERHVTAIQVLRDELDQALLRVAALKGENMALSAVLRDDLTTIQTMHEQRNAICRQVLEACGVAETLDKSLPDAAVEAAQGLAARAADRDEIQAEIELYVAKIADLDARRLRLRASLARTWELDDRGDPEFTKRTLDNVENPQ